MKLNYKRTFLIGSAFFSICAFWELFDSIVPLILRNTFGFKDTLTGVVMSMGNVLALFLIPLSGILSDKTNTRFGKRTPYIVIGTAIAVLSMSLIPLANKNHNIILLIISLIVVLVAMGMYRTPAVALMPDLTSKALLSKANSVINLMGAIGALITLCLVRFLVPKEVNPDYTMIFLAIAILMVVAVTVLVITIKEKPLSLEKICMDRENNIDEGQNSTDKRSEGQKLPKEIKRSLIFLLVSAFLWFMAFNAIATGFSRYATHVWELKGGSFASVLIGAWIVVIVCYIPLGIISDRIGRWKVIIFGIALMAGSFLCTSLFSQYSPWISVIFIFTAVGWASINVNAYPMIVELCRSSEVGKYTGLYYTFTMAGQIITPILSGFLLQTVSYRTLFPYAVVFSLLSLCTMLFVRHGKSGQSSIRVM